MGEEEKKIVEKFKKLYLKDFNHERIMNEDRLSYLECALISNLIEKQQKEIKELKQKYDKDTHILQNELDYANADRIEKDKIIDLMARFIDTELSSEHLSKVLKIEVKPLETYREDIKQYFKKKVGN